MANKSAVLEKLLKERILVLDGAMGTAIQDRNLGPEDFGGEELEGCNENLVLTRPDVIRDIHELYLGAGADIVETNTFGATPIVLDEYGLGAKTEEINRRAVELAREAADKYETPDKPRFVAGSIGPTTKAISVTGGITFSELQKNFYAQAKALVQAGADYLLIETCQDTRNVKAALLACMDVFKDLKQEVPIAVSGTIEPMGTMLAGQSVEALITSIKHVKLLYIGLNCATGPEFMTDHIRSLAQLSPFPVACVPNAGLPDEDGNYLETPQMVSTILQRFAQNSWINLVGGCCGTTPGHIEVLAKMVAKQKPRVAQPPQVSALSGVDYLEITDEMRPVLVGERTNVIGSRKFKRLICDENFDEASDIARAQIKMGAQVLDVCLANPDRDEAKDVDRFMEMAIKKVRLPFMIDSTDEAVVELALTYSQGKAIINSVNLEDGEERFEKICPLAKRFGAALVVGTIDDDPKQGMGVTRQRKLEIAKRSVELLTQKYGIPMEDLYFDPLVFPCATGDENYIGSAVETIEGVRLIKQHYPLVKTVLGISNVSFGLPDAGREVLNSVFLYHCVQAGLDMAIVNTEKLERYASIPEHERQLADDLLWNRGDDPVSAFANHFREKKPLKKVEKSKLSLEERLSSYIIEGSKDGLTADLDLALRKYPSPLEIINGPLMAGMDEVGRLFNANKLIVAEVLQSAEAMKAAVAHLEPHMEKSGSSHKGKILLATVKGDVHDIGKNLVDIILTNNGFEVVNLGIKVPPEQLIQAIREHSPDIVGLSGLLVKSAQQMVITADDFSKAGVKTPVLVGGAALSENFVDKKIAKAYTTGTVAYAQDAMGGLDLAKRIVSQDEFENFKAELEERRLKKEQEQKVSFSAVATVIIDPAQRSSLVGEQKEIPQPPDFKRHVILNTPIQQIWPFINPLMLHGRHLGIKGGVVRQLTGCFAKNQPDARLYKELKEKEAKALKIWETVEEVKQEYKDSEILKPGAVYRFFHASAEENRIALYETIDNGKSVPVTELSFARQQKKDGLCLADYIRLKSECHQSGFDNLALFVTTVGRGVRDLAEQLKNKGDYLKSHIVQALAIESAEAYAEMLHSQIRKMWGFADDPAMTMMQRFQAKYRGKRYSFGYPACPRLDDQEILFQLLQPKEIGVQLTDGFMMDPEASVSALVFHHPDATYYSVGQAEEENRG